MLGEKIDAEKQDKKRCAPGIGSVAATRRGGVGMIERDYFLKARMYFTSSLASASETFEL